MITGPMFSGKTTELKRLLRNFNQKEMNILLVRHSSDVRSIDKSADEALLFLTNHDGERINVSSDGTPKKTCISVRSLASVDTTGYDVIAVEEGQFFDDLTDTVLEWVGEKKLNVIVLGLLSYAHLSDHRFLTPLDNVLHLIPHANSYTGFKSVCDVCKNDEGLYHFRHDQSDSAPQMCVGGKNMYGVACRGCIKIIAASHSA